MKFVYQYRTKDNEICRGEIAAADRDAAYAELRAKGIKASRMDEAPGFLNKLFGKGKRWIAIGVLTLAAAAAVFGWLLAERQVAEAMRIDDAVPRHQIYGDPEVVAKFGHYDGLRGVLGNDGDAVLACFAQPGKIASGVSGRDAVAFLKMSMNAEQKVLADDAREIKELKQIVNWLRREMVAYVEYDEDQRSQVKKFESYYNRLIQRTANEKRVYDMIERELQDCGDEHVREEKNAKLRKLGLPTIADVEK